MNILANPLYFPPTHFSHPAFGPWTVAGVEGLLWGLILWKWSHGRRLAILLGVAINATTVALFWLAMRREQYLWDYDYQIVSIGEICVVVLEAGAVTWYLSRILNRSASSLWVKVLGISILLNAVSFFMGAYLVQSPIPGVPVGVSGPIWGSSPGWRGRRGSSIKGTKPDIISTQTAAQAGDGASMYALGMQLYELGTSAKSPEQRNEMQSLGLEWLHKAANMGDKMAVEALNSYSKNTQSEQSGTDQSTTKPADKTPVMGQPSSPTSKDGPR